MFLGQFQHNLDDKGRLMIPARFRDELLDGGATRSSSDDTQSKTAESNCPHEEPKS